MSATCRREPSQDPSPRARWALVLLASAALAACGGDGSDRERSRAGDVGTAAGETPAARTLGSGDRVVVFGDSLATGTRPWPRRLGSALGPQIRSVAITNIARPGTTSADWLPGSPLFDDRLAPALESADVVLVTVGGNDLQEALGGSDGIDSVAGARRAGGVQAVRRAIRGTRRNLATTFDAIRAIRPRARIGYVSYPDYSRATVWRQALGLAETIAFGSALAELRDAGAAAGPDLLVDMHAATAGADLDALLSDGEHLSDAGHALYARRIAASLRR